MTHTQAAVSAVANALPPDVPRGPLDGLIAQIIAELVALLRGKCFESPDQAYAYLTREYWLDPWGWRESRRRAAISKAIDEVVGRRLYGDSRGADVAKAVRTALAANLTLPLLKGLYAECE